MAKTEQPLDAVPATPVRQSKIGLLYVCLAVFFFSTSPIFVRWSSPFTSIEIAFWRLAIATALVAAMGILTRQRLLLKRQEVPRFLFYGLVTALHFLTYISSLSFTTIAHALALAYTSPIFVTLFSAIFLHEPLPRRKYLGIVIAVIGIAIMAGFQPNYTACTLTSTGHCMVLGDAIALMSGICFAIYSVAGRERARPPPTLSLHHQRLWPGRAVAPARRALLRLHARLPSGSNRRGRRAGRLPARTWTHPLQRRRAPRPRHLRQPDRHARSDRGYHPGHILAGRNTLGGGHYWCGRDADWHRGSIDLSQPNLCLCFSRALADQASTPQEAHQVHAAGVSAGRTRYRVPWAKAARRTATTPHCTRCSPRSGVPPRQV